MRKRGKQPLTCGNRRPDMLELGHKRPPRAVTPGDWPNSILKEMFDMVSIPEPTHAHGIRPWAQ